MKGGNKSPHTLLQTISNEVVVHMWDNVTLGRSHDAHVSFGPGRSHDMHVTFGPGWSHDTHVTFGPGRSHDVHVTFGPGRSHDMHIPFVAAVYVLTRGGEQKGTPQCSVLSQ